jgi:hypothetical protein
MREKVLLLIQNIVGICKQITILILHEVTSRLVTTLKVISMGGHITISVSASKFSKSL